MIKISTFLLTALLFLTTQSQVFSQTNGSFNYQAVVRKATGTLVQKTAISVKFSITDKTDGLVFSETQNVTTDAYGVINLTIGNGINHTGSLANINWENSLKLKVEVDYNKDGWMDLTGTSDITQVPKSFYSSKAGVATKAEGLTYDLAPVAVSGDYKDLINKPAEQTLSLDNNYQLNISNGNSVDLSILKDNLQKLTLNGNLLSIDGGEPVDLSSVGIIQSLNLSGSTLSISGGNSVTLPGGNMVTTVYDSNDNNKVDVAENAEKIQGIAISGTLPLTGQVLQYNGTNWVPGVASATDEKVKVGAGEAQVLSTTDFDGTNDIVIKNGAITSNKLADESVTDEKIASGISASKVGLGNVDNTSDVNKPISIATQAALNLKATIASPAFTGTPTAPTASIGNATTQIATTAFVSNAVSTIGKATASNGLTATNGNVTLGGALTAATTINQGTNDVNFTGNGKVNVDNLKVNGGVYISHIRTHALATNVVWQADDYLVILTNIAIDGKFALPDPTTNAGRVLCVLNETGGDISVLNNDGKTFPNITSNLVAGYGHMFISDGINWYFMSGR